jgi:hypothetical protein
MLDVHAPHGGMHTWKDFWIHLGTITLGLLIAVGLEQSVEKLHQLHERHQLEDDLRDEALKNHVIMDRDERYLDARMMWLLARRRDVDIMRASHGVTRMPYRPWAEFSPPDPFHLPSTAVWDAAKEGALVDLLPRGETRLYTIVYSQFDHLVAVSSDYSLANAQLSAFEAQFANGLPPLTPDLSRMDSAQLDRYAELLAAVFVAEDESRQRLIVADGMNAAMLNGARSDDDLVHGAADETRTRPYPPAPPAPPLLK